MRLPKLTDPDANPTLDASAELTHPNVWSKEVFPDWQRLVIGAREHEIGLILELGRGMRGPFSVLYVLLVSRMGNPDGRYESERTLSYDELQLFLYTYQEFFEQDGRHHLWVVSTSGEGQFIFDNHNVVYAYGDLAAYERVLRDRGFREDRLSIPAPHSHNYHPDFDASESAVIDHWPWRRSPLDPDDDP